MDKKEQDYYNDCLISEVAKGNIEKSIEWIKKGASIHTLNEKNQSLVTIAALMDQKDMFDWLLEISQGGKKINLSTQDREGKTALHTLIRGQHKRKNYYINGLVEAGIDTNLYDHREISPLLEAAYFDDLEAAEILLKNPNTNVRYQTKSDKVTAFLAACRENNLEFVRMLNERDPDVTLDVNGDGKNGLLIAISMYIPKTPENEVKAKENSDLCIYLLTNSNSDINIKDAAGQTPLFSSISLEKKEIYDYLLANGVNADIIHNDPSVGVVSALHIACMKNDDELIRKLHANGARFGVLDERNNTPESYGFTSEKTRQTMLDLNADVNAFFYQGYSKNFGGSYKDKIPVLSFVLSNGDADLHITKEMIARGAKVHYTKEELDGKFEFLPIYTSIMAGGLESTKTLMTTNEIDINTTLHNDTNLLMLALSDKETQKSRLISSQKELLQEVKEQQKVNAKNNLNSNQISKESLEKIEKSLNEVNKFEEETLNNKKGIIQFLIESNINIHHLDENKNNALRYVNNEHFMEFLENVPFNFSNENKNGLSAFSEIMLNSSNSTIKENFYTLYKDLAPQEIDNFLYNISFLQSSNHVQSSRINNAVINFLNLKFFNYGEEENKTFQEVLKENIDLIYPEYAEYINECNEKIVKNLMKKDEVIKRDIYEEAFQITIEKTGLFHLDMKKLEKKNFSIYDYKEGDKIVEFINKQDENGNHAILSAASHGNLSLISLLHKLGGDINQVNQLGENAIMHVIGNNDIDGVRYLHKMNADFQHRRNDGKNALDLADEIENKNLIKQINELEEKKLEESNKIKMKP